MTDEQRVKEKWPDAFAFEFDRMWQIGSASYSFPLVPLDGEFPLYLSGQNMATEEIAWRDAASRLESEERK